MLDSAELGPDVKLSDLDDDALAQIVEQGLPDTEIGEVMPLGPGPAHWTTQRVREFVAFHHSRRGGIDGPAGEINFVILVDGVASGIVRLRQVELECFEVGMWLAHSARGSGIGTLVLTIAARKAAALGARTLIANTTASNRAALGALRRMGATIPPPTAACRLRVELNLTA